MTLFKKASKRMNRDIIYSFINHMIHKEGGMKARVMMKLFLLTLFAVVFIGFGVGPVIADEDDNLLEKPKAYVGSGK